jgi:histidinol dehydrogenase
LVRWLIATSPAAAVGGAQAIAAFAYGIPGKIPSCDAIVGPGMHFIAPSHTHHRARTLTQSLCVCM